MRLVTEADFERVATLNPDYYRKNAGRSRWAYYRVVLEMLKRLEFASALELGPYMLPLIDDSETMDIRPELHPTYFWNASVTPWPINKQYDVFVALQVFEHLGTQQEAAFGEVMRVAKQAIISIPYRWLIPHNPAHNGITDEVIHTWTHGLAAAERYVVAPDGSVDAAELLPFSRVILRFDFTAVDVRRS